MTDRSWSRDQWIEDAISCIENETPLEFLHIQAMLEEIGELRVLVKRGIMVTPRSLELLALSGLVVATLGAPPDDQVLEQIRVSSLNQVMLMSQQPELLREATIMLTMARGGIEEVTNASNETEDPSHG